MNPHYKAFTVDTEEELAKKWALIPDDVDILVTHSPPYGILDGIPILPKTYPRSLTIGNRHVGSDSLLNRIERVMPKIHVFGNIHQSYGEHFLLRESWQPNDTRFINASHVNERYQPVNKPIRVIL